MSNIPNPDRYRRQRATLLVPVEGMRVRFLPGVRGMPDNGLQGKEGVVKRIWVDCLVVETGGKEVLTNRGRLEEVEDET